MKKYFTIAAVLGVIAFASVSFLAQADQQSGGNAMAKQRAAKPAPATDPSDGEAAADEAAAAPVDPKFDQDDQECASVAAQPKDKSGADPTDAQVNSAYKKCMLGKGHTYEEMKEHSTVDDSGKDGAKDKGEGAEE